MHHVGDRGQVGILIMYAMWCRVCVVCGVGPRWSSKGTNITYQVPVYTCAESDHVTYSRTATTVVVVVVVSSIRYNTGEANTQHTLSDECQRCFFRQPGRRVN